MKFFFFFLETSGHELDLDVDYAPEIAVGQTWFTAGEVRKWMLGSSPTTFLSGAFSGNNDKF